MHRVGWILVASVVAVPPAAAQSCGELVGALAAEMNLDLGRVAAPSLEGQSLSEQLTDSGGVIEPPPIDAPGAIEPPPIGSDMPTAPSIPPQTAEGEKQDAAPAARQAQLESLLTAAHAAAERGDEAECLARLEEAQQIAAAEP